MNPQISYMRVERAFLLFKVLLKLQIMLLSKPQQFFVHLSQLAQIQLKGDFFLVY